MGEIDLTDMTPLGELIPGLADLDRHPTLEQLGKSLHGYLAASDELTWTKLASMSLLDISLIPNMGPIRTKRVLSAISPLVDAESRRRDQSTFAAESGQDAQILRALREIAAWAQGNGLGGSVVEAVVAASTSDAVDVPRAELEWLGEVPTAELVTQSAAAKYDPFLVATALIDGFDERERATLERILDFDRSAPTLQAIGEQLGVTRERVRQIESKVAKSLTAALSAPDCRSLVAAADRLRERLGAAVPGNHLVDEFAEYPPDLMDRLILHLAGPYRFDGDWYVLDVVGNFDDAIRSAFDAVADAGVAPLAAFEDAIGELGVRVEFVSQVVAGLGWARIVDDDIMDWSGSLPDKAVTALTLADRPLSFEEMVEFVQPNSERSLSNGLGSDERISRVGVGRFGLAEWDLGEFSGVVPAMIDRLGDGPVALEALQDELAAEYGVSPASVGIISSTHPVFLREGTTIMLRPEDQPYVSSTDLVGTRFCYQIDGAWSWRVPVDRDILRGSGRAIPEAFAAHIGALPLEKGSLDSPVGPIALRWNQQPTIGSLRAAARSLDADDGDWLFVRRVSPSELDFTLVRDADLADDPEQRLRALVGAGDSEHSLERVLADALGLRGSINHDLAEEREALESRREKLLLELLAQVEG